MATLHRRPLQTRSLPVNVSPSKHTRPVAGPSKRPRSPEPQADASTSQQAVKRAKVTAAVARAPKDTNIKDRKHEEREQQRVEFREKFTRAFPSWIFYLDTESLKGDKSALEDYAAGINCLRGV